MLHRLQHEETFLQVLLENGKFLLKIFTSRNSNLFQLFYFSQASAFAMSYDSLYYDCLQIPKILYIQGECQSISF